MAAPMMDFHPFPPDEKPPRRGTMSTTLVVGVLCLAGGYLIAHAQADANLTALQETLRSEFKKIGDSYQAKGHIGTQADVTNAATKTLGKTLVQSITSEGGHIVGTVEAQGTVPASIEPLAPIPSLPTQDGSFDGSAAQDRGGLPPLTTARFVFHPGAGLSVGWENHAETFRLGFAEWRTAGDGLRAAVRLSREVGGKVEEIRLDSADAVFPQSEVERRYPEPKYAFGIGAGQDVNGKARTNVVFEKFITPKFSVQTGYINGRPTLIAKYIWR